MMEQWWAGPNLDQGCLAMHNSSSLLKIKCPIRAPEMYLGGSLDVFVPLPNVAILTKASLSAFDCYLFHWHSLDQWPNLAYWGSGA